jgi:hypothetical protein
MLREVTILQQAIEELRQKISWDARLVSKQTLLMTYRKMLKAGPDPAKIEVEITPMGFKKEKLRRLSWKRSARRGTE